MYLLVSNITEVVNWILIGIRKASQGCMTWPASKQILTILQVWGHCLTGRENCFQQSGRSAAHVGEGLHSDSRGLQVCPELHVILCKLNESLHYHIIQSSGWPSFFRMSILFL